MELKGCFDQRLCSVKAFFGDYIVWVKKMMRFNLGKAVVLKLPMIFKWIFVLTAIFLTSKLNQPFMHQCRGVVGLVLFIGLMVLITKSYRSVRYGQDRFVKSFSQPLYFGVLLTAVGFVCYVTATFQYKKYVVLHTPPSLLKTLGAHFIIGYQDPHNIRRLVKKGAIGGVYITARNINAKTIIEVKSELDAFQATAAKSGLPPLFIAADQEGGLVSRLSFLFKRLPPLASLDEDDAPLPTMVERVEKYAALQARQLNSLGVNLNLSPVVDLKIDHLDQAANHFTRIDRRAISSDVDKIINIARVYCETLLAHGIWPTLKHFPGLGHVTQETHFVPGTLEYDRTYLEQNDWRPFREIGTQISLFIMLGHVRIPSIDPCLPASLSSVIITDIIRKDWGYDGVLITDDLNMGAIAGRREGIGNAAVRAVNAGADLILLSYDGSQYYPVMYAMINAYRKGRLNLEVLNQSRRRICKHRPIGVGKKR